MDTNVEDSKFEDAEKNKNWGLANFVVDQAKEQLKQVLSEQIVSQVNLDGFVDIGQTSKSLLVHCIGEYLSSTLPEESLAVLGKHLKSQADEYLLELLKFNHSYSIQLSHDPNQARLFALRTAIHYKYPLLKTEGSTCISRPPVFYGTSQYPLFREKQPESFERSRFAWELLQDQTSFNQIPGHLDQNQDSNRALPPLTIDIDILEGEIERDLAKGRLPCAVLASHLDDLEGIRQLCDRHRLWLHVEGGSSSLLLAAGTCQPSCTKTLLDCANSISAQPFDWWKIDEPSQSQVSSAQIGSTCSLTFLRIDRQYEAPVFPVAASDFSLLFSLSRQFSLQDPKLMIARVDHSLFVCDHLKRQLQSHGDLFSITIGPDPALLPHVLLFQIIPNSDHVNLSHLNLDENAFHSIFQAHVDPSLIGNLALTQVPYQGATCFMFQPLKIPNVDTSIGLENINLFVDAICDQIKLLESAVQARSMFEEHLSSHPDLEPVPYQEVKSFVGIGAFRFVPEVLSNEKAISSLNIALAQELERHNAIYTLSDAQDGMACVAITISEKMSSLEFITELVDKIREATVHLTFPQDVLDNMSLAIKEGINTAESKIQEHNAEAYRPDTLIRKIPVVGSMYGWMFPTVQKDDDLGHTYDIRLHRLSAPQLEVIKQLETDAKVDENGDQVKLRVSFSGEKCERVGADLNHEQQLDCDNVNMRGNGAGHPASDEPVVSGGHVELDKRVVPDRVAPEDSVVPEDSVAPEDSVSPEDSVAPDERGHVERGHVERDEYMKSEELVMSDDQISDEHAISGEHAVSAELVETDGLRDVD